MSGFDHLVSKTLEAAAGHIGVLSTGEALAAALVLNRSDWLARMGYSIPDALDRIGPEWREMLTSAADVVKETRAAVQVAVSTAAEESALDQIEAISEVDVTARLVTVGSSPGYRHTHFSLDMTRYGGEKSHRVRVNLNKTDSAKLLEHMLDIQRVAWSDQGPIDKAGEEKPPRWLKPLL